MAGLLVSVRSVDEARAALAGGAAVVDVKEPDRGPLGRADPEVWLAVRQAVPPEVPVSVALGELAEWADLEPPAPGSFAGLAYRKLGLARSGRRWAADWERLRGRLGPGPAWIAVAYADWSAAGAPGPDEVLEVALAATDCAGVLVDTWDKRRPAPIDKSWAPWVVRARRAGRLVALAGGLDAVAIARLAPLRPDLFAVRGAACAGSDRRSTVDPDRVALLARAAGSRGPATGAAFSTLDLRHVPFDRRR